jgi:hypothetical protein
MRKSFLGSLYAVLAMLGLLLPMQSSAAVVYTYVNLPFGDTTIAVDLNDHGQVLFCCFGDSSTKRGWLDGHDLFGFDGGFHALPEEINNAGMVRGTAARRDGSWVPTVWVDFIPYDMTDPANAGIVFERDPGPQWTAFDLAGLTVSGLPDCFVAHCTAENGALTNSRGDLVFLYNDVRGPSYIQQSAMLVASTVPEPPTWLLAMPMLALLWRQRRFGA